MSGSFLPAINAAGHSTSFPGDPPLSTDANEDEAILQQAGLNPLQAQDIVELLREQNLDVMGMVRWKHEQLDAFWNEAFPRMEPAKLASVMKQLHILLHQKCGTVMTAPNPYRYSAPAREAAAQATPSYLWFVKGNPDITAALDHYNFSMDTWTDVEKEAGDLLTYEMRQNKTQMLKNQNLYERNVGMAIGSPPGSAGRPDENRMCRQSSKLVHDYAKDSPPSVASPTSGSSPMARSPRPPPPAARAFNAPAQWRSKAPLHQLLRQQFIDTEGSIPEDGHQTPKRVRASPRQVKCKVPTLPGGPRPDYASMLGAQKADLDLSQQTLKEYGKTLNNLLHEQVDLKKEAEENPWDRTLGAFHDREERMLKRKLLWLIGAAPPPEDMDKAEGALSQEIQEEIKELVAQIDTDGDGLLDDYEIAQKMEGDPLLQGRLQALRINVAMNNSRKQFHTSRMKQAVLKLQLHNLRQRLSGAGDGYVKLSALVNVAKHDPVTTRKLGRLGINLDRLIRHSIHEAVDPSDKGNPQMQAQEPRSAPEA